jgi:lipopolysaccharide/colanic/teichoic acid biosynthesis glycosyltransferase
MSVGGAWCEYVGGRAFPEPLRLFDRSSLVRPGVLKRILDVGIGVALGVALLAVMVIIGVGILLSSGHPILYRQKRCGRGGRPFFVLKFRTMVVDADAILQDYLARDVQLAQEWRRAYKLVRDPRVTRFGKLLRRTSLDELPQLWNVIRGDMSLVGPRPITCEEIRLYGDAFELYKLVRPGITGLWQVSGRGRLSYDKRVQLDVAYIRNWSIWLDLWIVFKTLKVVLNGDGAY